MPNQEIIIYQTEDGSTKIEVTLEEETVWLSQAQMAELFQTTKQNISLHINNCFKEGELENSAVVKDSLTTASDGKKYRTKLYNLDVIISVGYRVKSNRGTQFRKWAMNVLREYLIKGYSMNDELLKEAGGGLYWKELLERIRDIRSSEKVFYRQVLDIYATSVDYDPRTDESRRFFQNVQNKIHYAAHGNTAAEVIHSRADASKPFMGLTSFKGELPRKSEVTVAKNYLSQEELAIMNRFVTAYLEFAELQALRRQPMYMSDWRKQLDSFITLSGSQLLQRAGTVTAMEAQNKAELEYLKYKNEQDDFGLSQAEKDFLAYLDEVQKKLEEKPDSENKK